MSQSLTVQKIRWKMIKQLIPDVFSLRSDDICHLTNEHDRFCCRILVSGTQEDGYFQTPHTHTHTPQQSKSLEQWWGFPGGTSGKESACQCRRPGFNPRVGKILWRKKWQPTPVFLPAEFHGERSLVYYSPRGHKESDTTEGLTHTHVCIYLYWI